MSHFTLPLAYFKNAGKKNLYCTFLLAAVFGLIATSHGQAGSHGKKYVVAQQHAAASNDNPGTAAKPFRSISKAAALAQPGDTVLVYTGTYREWVAPARGGKEGRPITYMGAPNQQVVIKGSEIYTGEWQPVAGHPGVFSTKLPAAFFTAGFNPFKIVFDKWRGGGRQGQVFIDGNELFEAKEPANTSLEERKKTDSKTNRERMYEQSGTWCTEDGETLSVHLPANAKPLEKTVVEISVRRHLFAPVRRAQNYINVKGFIFEHCANEASFPQVGAVSCRSGQHWTIENNIVRKIKTIGIDFGAEDEDPWLLPDILPEDRYYIGRHHDFFTLAERRIAGRNRILNNLVSDCGQCGIAGLFSDGSVVMGNTVERCGAVVPGFETGGIKIHGLMGGTVEGNLVRDNEAWGIWLDCGYIGSRVTRNVVVNNKISGIFFECSNGPGLIDNNVIAYNRGDGIYAHDASGINVANNLIFGNTNFGIYMCVATDRLVPPYHYATGLYENELSACSWERISNNMIVKNAEGAISLPQPGVRAQDNFSDYNLFDLASNGSRFVRHFRNGEKHSSEEVVDEARKAFMKYGDANLTGADLALWKNDKGFAMNLPQWQAATGYEKHSLAGHIDAQLDLKTFELVVTLDETAKKLNCPRVTTLNVRDFAKFTREIDKDFAAQSMPVRNWLPGSFQSFQPGTNKATVWPVTFAYPAMPPKVAMEPAAGAEGLKPVPPPAQKSK
jgi:parallel beta-helix repeat protein